MPAAKALLCIVTQDPPMIRSPTTRATLANFVHTCLKKDPEDRPTSTLLLRHALLNSGGKPHIYI
eukprot:NODE_2797_length_865_cov_22.246324_g2309_i0.p4 GENE.NODE_2797_length_865_cov_22.246324_g2309_i0~~NODE_2797_length_865_cov_22.246324_g2309_i0.p4  ORF type:complete len:65 (-),score=14.55 NODE_2797_length_865_cov_22.246324_g2309_i0:487-681(-)